MAGAGHISHAAAHLQPQCLLWKNLSGGVAISHKINEDHAESMGKKIKKKKKKNRTSSNTGQMISPARYWKELYTFFLCLWEIYLVGLVALLRTLCSLIREINHLRLNNLCFS